MEERKYTFYDRYQKVKYANITAEELEVLNIFYNKEHYMFDQQHQRNNTVLFCGLESDVNVNEKVYHPLTKKFTTPLAN
ncbi:hypothetical protein ACTNB0_14385 [Lachnospiraceae bacterium HCP28S3_F9]